MKTKVAITQFACTSSYEENVNKAISMVEKCVKEGANIVLLQELFSSLYFCQVEDYDKFSWPKKERHQNLFPLSKKLLKNTMLFYQSHFLKKVV